MQVTLSHGQRKPLAHLLFSPSHLHRDAFQTAYLHAADLTAVTLKARKVIHFIQPERGALHKYTPLSYDANFCHLHLSPAPCLEAGSDQDSPIQPDRPAVQYFQECSHHNHNK